MSKLKTFYNKHVWLTWKVLELLHVFLKYLHLTIGPVYIWY